MVNVHSEPKYSIATPDYRCEECAEEVACEAPYHSAVIFAGGEFQRRNYCVACWKRRTGQSGAGPEDETGGASGPGPIDVFASWRGRRPAAPAERPKKVRFDAQLALEFFLRLGREPGELSRESDEHSCSGDEDSRGGDLSGTAPPETPGDGTSETSQHGTPVEESNAPEVAPRDVVPQEEGARPGTASESGEAERHQLRFFLALLLVRKKVLQYKSSVDRGGEEWLRLADRSAPPQVHEVLNPGLTEGQLERLKDRLGELLQMRI